MKSYVYALRLSVKHFVTQFQKYTICIVMSHMTMCWTMTMMMMMTMIMNDTG